MNRQSIAEGQLHALADDQVLKMSQENERGAIYINAAERAREILQHDITASYESCGHDANLLIVLFLQ